MQYHSSFSGACNNSLKFSKQAEKYVSVDSNSLGPVGEVYLKFKIGNVVFHDRFMILNNLQCDIILGLPWQQNYRIGCTWNQEGKHFITINNQFLALSIALCIPRQLDSLPYKVDQLRGFLYKHHKA